MMLPDADAGLRERQYTIESRLRQDMRASLSRTDAMSLSYQDFEDLLDALVGDAMHHVDLLLRECT